MDRIRKTILPCGATLITGLTDVSPVLALRLYVRTGSLHERPEEAGAAHFLEHLVFRGTASRTRSRIITDIEDLGGAINAWTSHEVTSFHTLLASRHLDTALDVLADLAGAPLLPPDELDVERSIVLEEIRKAEEQPDTVLEQELLTLLFDGHALARPIYGSATSLQAMTREVVAAFHRDCYRTGNLVLVAVGDFDRERLLRAAVERLQRFLPGRPAREVPPAQGPGQTVTSALQREVEEDRVGVAFVAPPAQDERSVLADLMALLVGGSDNALGYRQLVHDQGLFSDFQGSTLLQEPAGVLQFQGWSGREKPLERLRGLFRLLASLRERPLGRDLLERTLRSVAAARVFERETVEGEASRLGLNECAAHDPHHDARYAELLQSVTPADLLEFARETLQPENLALSGVFSERSPALKLFREGQAAALAQEVLATRPRRSPRPRRARPDAAVSLVEIGTGVRVVLRPDRAVPVVSAVAAMPGGARFETASSAGTSALLADMLPRGARGLSSREILNLQEEIGGELSSFAGRNSLGLQVDFLSERQDQGLELLSQVLFAPSFPAAELDVARRQQLDDLRGLADVPGELGMEVLFELAFPGHPYGLRQLGTEETVGRLTRRDLNAAWRSHASRGNVVVALVGDLDRDRALRRLEDASRSLPAPTRDPFQRLPAPFPSTPVRRFMPRAERKTDVLLAFPGVDVHDPRRYALEILANLLSAQSGRLFSSLREDHGGVYDVDAVTWEGLDAGVLVVTFSTSPELAGQCLELFWSEVRALLDGGVTHPELQRAQLGLVGGFEISFQRRSNVAYHLAYDEAYRLGREGVREYAERIHAVTRAQVEEAARAALGSPGRVEVFLGPDPIDG
jgi:zinc protease